MTKIKITLLPIVGIAVILTLLLVLIAVSIAYLLPRGATQDDIEQLECNQERTVINSQAPDPDESNIFFCEGFDNKFIWKDISMASCECIGYGTFGRTNKCVVKGFSLVLKTMRNINVSKSEFKQIMDSIWFVGNHPNVATPIGYVFLREVKCLFYAYCAAGSLRDLLHGGNMGTQFGWVDRVHIALRTAEGIAHLHNVGGPTFVVGNIKSSNVLIEGNDQYLDARISDVGLWDISNRSSPEFLEYTQDFDVFSFGVLLFEILTGREPSQSAMEGLPNSVLREYKKHKKLDKVVDARLLKETFFRQDLERIKREMKVFFELAKDCVEERPGVRPTMNQVVIVLRDLFKVHNSKVFKCS